ncbi:autotransporter domain-containing protein, partial [Herbaspirillum sp. RTI4]
MGKSTSHPQLSAVTLALTAALAAMVHNTAMSVTLTGPIAVSSDYTVVSGDVITGGIEGITTSGVIGTLSNSGTIHGNSSSNGINAGAGSTIGVINNQGSIGNAGIGGGIKFNAGVILGTLNNSGTIGGGPGSQGIWLSSSGTIGTLNNSGTITGTNNGIIFANASGKIGTINNSGTINGGGNGIQLNLGTIGSLTNSGTISGGSHAINVGATASMSPINNSGVIAGAIANAAAHDLIINGGSGSVFGTLTGLGGTIANITNTSSNVVFGTGNQVLNNNINVGTNTVTNISTGVLQVNNPLTITGNYNQGANASLIIGVADSATATGSVSDTGYGRLMVSGSATFAANSTVTLMKLNSYAFAQGQRFVVVQAASSGTNYNAGSLVYSATGYNGTVTGSSVVDGSNLDLLLTIGSLNPAAPVLPVIVATKSNAGSALTGLFGYGGVNPNLLNLYNASAALSSTSTSNHAGAQLSPAATAAASREGSKVSTQAVLNVVVAHIDYLNLRKSNSGVTTGESAPNLTLWGQAFSGASNQDEREDVAGYRDSYNGLMIGADTRLSEQWLAGGLLSYGNTWADSTGDNAGSSAQATSVGLMAYARYFDDPWYLDLAAGAVRHQYRTLRSISFPGFDGAAAGQFNRDCPLDPGLLSCTSPVCPGYARI